MVRVKLVTKYPLSYCVDREKVEVTADGKSGFVSVTAKPDVAIGKFVVESEYIEVKETVSFGRKIPTDGLIAEYTFFEGAGTVLHDTSGNNLNANIYGAQWAKLPTGKIVLKFDGVDDYCIAESSLFDFSKYDEFTILVWALRDKKGHGGVIGYEFILHSSPTRSPSMWFWPSEKDFHFGFGDGSVWYKTTIEGVLDMNKWFLLGIRWRYSDSKLEGLVNANYVGEVDTKGSRPYSNTKYTIGKIDYYHSGLIGCAYIYAKYLSDQKIEKIYKATAPLFGISP